MKEIDEIVTQLEKQENKYQNSARSVIKYISRVFIITVLILVTIIALSLCNILKAQSQKINNNFNLINFNGGDPFSIKGNNTGSNNLKNTKDVDTIIKQVFTSETKINFDTNRLKELVAALPSLTTSIKDLSASLNNYRPERYVPKANKTEVYFVYDTTKQPGINNYNTVSIPPTHERRDTAFMNEPASPAPPARCSAGTLAIACTGFLVIISCFMLLFLSRLYRYNLKMASLYESRAMAFKLTGLKDGKALNQLLQDLSLKDILTMTSTASIDIRVPKDPRDDLMDIFKKSVTDNSKTKNSDNKCCCCKCCNC